MGEIFERATPAAALEWTGERLTTGTAGQIEIEHLHRYFLARELCRGLDVLDVASGEGYGTALLAQVARSALGIDVSAAATRHAATNYQLPNLRFLEGDARHLPLGNACVDAVVSFETIEHFYEHDAFLSEIKRVLRPGGRLIMSSPDRDIYSPQGSPANPFHARELTRGEFEALLGQSFAHVRLLSQRPILGSALVASERMAGDFLTFERRGGNHFEVSSGLPRAAYLVAVASEQELPAVPESLYIETGDVGALLSRAALASALETISQAAQSRAATAETLAARRVEEGEAQAKAAADQLAAADSQLHAAKDQLEADRERAEAVMAAMRDDLEQARSAFEKAQADAATAEGDIAGLRTEVKTACAQRDMARVALRRAGVFAENGWRIRLKDAEQRLLDEQNRAEGLQHRLAAQQQDLASAQREAEAWRIRYDLLRNRMEAILRRFWVLPASRVVPRPIRHWVRERLLGGRR